MKYSVVFLAILFTVSVQAFPIDNFESPLPETTVEILPDRFNPPPRVNATTVVGINSFDTIGGSRTVILEMFAQEDDASLPVQLRAGRAAPLSPSKFSTSIPTGVEGASTIIWDGKTDANDVSLNVNGLPGIDFTNGGTDNAFRIALTSGDIGFLLRTTVYFSSGGRAVDTFDPTSIPQSIAGLGLRLLTIPYARFLLEGGASPQGWNSVSAMTMEFIPREQDGIITDEDSFDVGIEAIETVPLIRITKSYEVLDADADGVAEPGDFVRFSVEVLNEQDLGAVPAENILLFDDIIDWIPLTGAPADVTVELFNPPEVRDADNNPTDEVPQILLSPEDGSPYGVSVSRLVDGQSLVLSYNVELGNLPCCMLQCDLGQTITVDGETLPLGCHDPDQKGTPLRDLESCYCQENQAFACVDVTPAEYNQFIASGELPREQCAPSNFELTNLVSPDPTKVPIWSSPDPRITLVRDTAGAEFTAGQDVEFTLSLFNDEPRASNNFVLAIKAPFGTSVNTDLTDDRFTCAANGECTMTFDSGIATDFSEDYAFAVTIDGPLQCGASAGFPVNAQIRFTPSACTCRDMNFANNFANETIPVGGSPVLSLVKSASSTDVLQGESISYTLEYKNEGNAIAENVRIVEPIPAHTTVDFDRSSAEFTAENCDATSCTASIGAVPPDGLARTLTFVVNVNQNLACNERDTTNTATIQSDCEAEPIPSNAVPVNIGGDPELEITKRVEGNDFAPTEQIEFVLQVSNVGGRVADGVQIHETVPEHTSFDSDANSGWVAQNGEYIYTVGILNAGASSEEISFFVIVDEQLACDDRETTNSVYATETCINDVSETVTVDVDLVAEPDVTLAKSFAIAGGASEIQPGFNFEVTYTFDFSNEGRREATGITIEDKIPTEFVVVEPLENGWSCDTNVIPTLCTYTYAGSLSFGQSDSTDLVLEYRTQGNADECTAPPVRNEAVINQACPTETDFSDNNADVEIQVATDITPTLEKAIISGPEPVGSDGLFKVTITYGNQGSLAAPGAYLEAEIPEHFTFNGFESSDDWEGCDDTSPAGTICTYQIGSIPAFSGTNAGSTNIAFNRVTNLACGVVQSTCTVRLFQGCDPEPLEQSEDIPLTATPMLFVEKDDFDAEFFQKSSVTYTITYGNTGDRGVTGGVLVDNVPADTSVNMDESEGWECPDGIQGPVACTYDLADLGEIFPGDNPAVTITLDISDPLPANIDDGVTNVVTFGSNPLCGANEPVADEPTPIIGNPDPTVSKTDNDFSAVPGDVIEYEITYENIGTRDDTGVYLEETIPLHTTFNSEVSTDGWDCPNSAALSKCRFPIGSLALNTPDTVIFAVTVDECVTCDVVSTKNTVIIDNDGASGAELREDNNEAMDETPIGGLPNLFITVDDAIESPPDDPKRPGEIIVYTVTWGHVEAGTLKSVREATNIVIKETVPEYTEFVPELSSPWNCENNNAGAMCTITVPRQKEGGASYEFTVRVVRPLDVGVTETTNFVSIMNDCGEADVTDNADNHPTPLEGRFDLIVQKHGYCAQYQWDLTYENIGTQLAEEVVITTHVPHDTVYNSDLSNAGDLEGVEWECEGETAGSRCMLRVGDVELSSGEKTVSFVVDTSPNAHITEIMHMSSIHAWVGDDADPTPENNRDTATIASTGCAECDSCCPEVDECCPDQTSVNFNFQGVLEGVNSDECRS